MKKSLLQIIAFLVTFSANAQNFNWTSQTSGGTTKLNDVFFVDSLLGWVVGDDGVILNTKDGGKNWSSQTSDITEILRSVFFINDTLGWAVGGQVKKAIIKTTDGGENWISLTADGISSNQMYDIAFFDTNIGWLITFNSIYRTTDGGDSWVIEDYADRIDTPTPRSIAITSDTVAFVAGTRKKSVTNTSADVFYRKTDISPNLWDYSYFDPSPLSGDSFNDVEFINSDIGFAGSRNGRLYKKTDYNDAGIWELSTELTGNQSIYSIAFPTETNGMFNSSVEISGNSYALIYHTSDSGETWSSSPDTIPDLILAVLHAPDSLNAWIVGNNGKIYKGEIAGGDPPTSIKHVGLINDINLYPNPAKDVVNVAFKTKKSDLVNYRLLDMTGRIVKSGNWTSNSTKSVFTLNISELVNGVYLLSLSTEDAVGTLRILKE